MRKFIFRIVSGLAGGAIVSAALLLLLALRLGVSMESIFTLTPGTEVAVNYPRSYFWSLTALGTVILGVPAAAGLLITGADNARKAAIAGVCAAVLSSAAMMIINFVRGGKHSDLSLFATGPVDSGLSALLGFVAMSLSLLFICVPVAMLSLVVFRILDGAWARLFPQRLP